MVFAHVKLVIRKVNLFAYQKNVNPINAIILFLKYVLIKIIFKVIILIYILVIINMLNCVAIFVLQTYMLMIFVKQIKYVQFLIHIIKVQCNLILQ